MTRKTGIPNPGAACALSVTDGSELAGFLVESDGAFFSFDRPKRLYFHTRTISASPFWMRSMISMTLRFSKVRPLRLRSRTMSTIWMLCCLAYCSQRMICCSGLYITSRALDTRT